MGINQDLLRHYATVQEVAEFLGITVQGVRYLISKGHIEAIKLGGRWLIVADSVEAWHNR